jgi:hypothetical protein
MRVWAGRKILNDPTSDVGVVMKATRSSSRKTIAVCLIAILILEIIPTKRWTVDESCLPNGRVALAFRSNEAQEAQLAESRACRSNFVYRRYHVRRDAPLAFAEGSTDNVGSLVSEVINLEFLGEDSKVQSSVDEIGLVAVGTQDIGLVGMKPDEEIFECGFRDIWEDYFVTRIVQGVEELFEIS